MTFTPFSGTGGAWSKITDTGAAGFALQNATPNIGAVWNVPNDGQAHSFAIYGQVHTTGAETGGQCQVTYTQPDGNNQTTQIDPGGHAAGTSGLGGSGTGVFSRQVQPGSTVQMSQGTALTAGAAVLFAALWGQ
jgi:hypothetical protein